MVLCTVYYRLKGNKNAKILTKDINSHSMGDARILAKSIIPKDCTIVKIEKD